jgi:hypothetical protein
MSAGRAEFAFNRWSHRGYEASGMVVALLDLAQPAAGQLSSTPKMLEWVGYMGNVG